MKKNSLLAVSFFSAICTVTANQQPTSNENPAYGRSHVQAQLRLNINENAEVVHFIRDTNDPKIITKTYILNYADPYSIRPYLREMVQTLRVDYNNPVGLENPDYFNVYNKDNQAETKKIFVPAGIECIKFADGTGALMVSAEEYRFQSHVNGMGIDELVSMLDQPGILNSSGQPKYIYFPVNRSARDLQAMIKLVGANVSNDTVELIGGKDKVECDEELNCLFLNTALYSRKHIEAMLKVYDIPHPEVSVACTVYELNAENDGMLGMDFQSWKNNDGIKLFRTGGTWSHNANLSDALLPVAPDGTVNTHYLNFEPKWNTKYLDFLVSKGKAEILTSGELTIQNTSTGSLQKSGGTLYAAVIPDSDGDGDDTAGNQSVEVRPENEKFKFELNLTPSISEQAATLQIQVKTTEMIGYASTGEVRTDSYETSQKIVLGKGRNRFYLGGIEKNQIVSDVVGVPVLKDIPVLGWIFSTERKSLKKSQLVVVAECEIFRSDSAIHADELREIEMIRNSVANAEEVNRSEDERMSSIDSAH